MKMRFHSHGNEFNLHVNAISFSYERMSTKTRSEKEAQDNSEMAYYICRGAECATGKSLPPGTKRLRVVLKSKYCRRVRNKCSERVVNFSIHR